MSDSLLKAAARSYEVRSRMLATDSPRQLVANHCASGEGLEPIGRPFQSLGLRCQWHLSLVSMNNDCRTLQQTEIETKRKHGLVVLFFTLFCVRTEKPQRFQCVQRLTPTSWVSRRYDSGAHGYILGGHLLQIGFVRHQTIHRFIHKVAHRAAGILHPWQVRRTTSRQVFRPGAHPWPRFRTTRVEVEPVNVSGSLTFWDESLNARRSSARARTSSPRSHGKPLRDHGPAAQRSRGQTPAAVASRTYWVGQGLGLPLAPFRR